MSGDISKREPFSAIWKVHGCSKGLVIVFLCPCFTLSLCQHLGDRTTDCSSLTASSPHLCKILRKDSLPDDMAQVTYFSLRQLWGQVASLLIGSSSEMKKCKMVIPQRRGLLLGNQRILGTHDGQHLCKPLSIVSPQEICLTKLDEIDPKESIV